MKKILCWWVVVLIGLAASSRANVIEITASVATPVADANYDGYGDENSGVPYPYIYMVAAKGMSGSGPGGNGVARMQFEWDLSALAGIPGFSEAKIVLQTCQYGGGSTYFYHGTADQDGLITNSDFEAPAALIAGPVLPGSYDQGVFEFLVTQQLRADFAQGYNFFSVQGRVDEDFTYIVGTEVIGTSRWDDRWPKLIVTVPEPASLVLLLGSLAFLRRRGCSYSAEEVR